MWKGDSPTCPQGSNPPVECFARSIVYQSTCTICHKDGEQQENRTGGSSCRQDGGGTYTGETSRSLYERVKEHLSNAKDLKKDSHIVKHWFLKHPQLQTQPTFKFKIIGKFTYSLLMSLSC